MTVRCLFHNMAYSRIRLGWLQNSQMVFDHVRVEAKPIKNWHVSYLGDNVQSSRACWKNGSSFCQLFFCYFIGYTWMCMCIHVCSHVCVLVNCEHTFVWCKFICWNDLLAMKFMVNQIAAYDCHTIDVVVVVAAVHWMLRMFKYSWYWIVNERVFARSSRILYKPHHT